MAQFVVQNIFDLTARDLIVIIGDIMSGYVQAGMQLEYNHVELLILSVETVKVKGSDLTGLTFSSTADAAMLIERLTAGDEVLLN